MKFILIIITHGSINATNDIIGNIPIVIDTILKTLKILEIIDISK